MTWLMEPWTYPFMRWALLACLILGGIHAYLGFHIVRRGVLFVDLAIAQAAALGSAVGVVIGLEHHTVSEYLLSAGFALGSAAFFAVVRSRHLHQEAVVAAFYGLCAAATFVVLERSPHGMEEVKHLFVGQVLTVAPDRVLQTLFLYLVLGGLHFWMHRRTMAVTEGTSASRATELFFYGTFALVVTNAVGLAGVLLVFAFLVLPAMSSILVSRTRQLLWGWVFVTVASVAGLQGAYYLDMPAAPMVVLTLGVLLLVSSLFSLRQGS